MLAPVYHGGHLDPLNMTDPATGESLYNLRASGFGSPYDSYAGYPASPYQQHVSQSYHQHSHYYHNNVYYGRQWW